MTRLQTLEAELEPFPGYRLRQLIGRGGFSEVWEARSPQGERVALKFLSCADQTPAREIQSIQAIRRLDHPALIRINNVWCFGGYIVVAMELAEGSLLDLLDAYQIEYESPIFAPQVCRYLEPVAEALDFLNARRHMLESRRVAIQHCDIKPSNLLLFDEIVKIADFGLSSFMTSTLQPHQRAGTLDYAAPEVFQGRLSERTDQYALAVTYCQLRGGRVPYMDTPTRFESRYVRPEPDLSMLSAEERPMIARALARVPQERWLNCTSLIRSLASVVGQDR